MMIMQLPWEKNTNGLSAFLKKRMTPKVSPSLLKIITRLKMTDVTLISASFQEMPISFEGRASVLIESSTYMEFFGAYTRAFSDEEPDEFPQICLRKAFWNQANERQYFSKNQSQKEYLLGELQISSILVFLNLIEANEVLTLISELENMLQQGIKIQEELATQTSDTELEVVEYSVTNGYLNYDFSYSPYKFKSDALKNWTLRWREAFKKIDQNAGFIADEGSQISYKPSLLEYLQF